MKKLLLATFGLFQASQLPSVIYLEPTPQFKPRFEISAVYVEYNDNILLLHRQNNKSEGNKWGIPGGKVDKNETPLQAAIREVKEETGYDLSNQPIEDVGTVYVEYNDTNHFIHHMFRTKLRGDPGAVKINFCEHKGFTWVTPADGLKMDLLKDEAPCIRLVYFSEKPV
jgi:8-oxo-dGTP pyrophosphatase MutT (NUDIX family)